MSNRFNKIDNLDKIYSYYMPSSESSNNIHDNHIDDNYIDDNTLDTLDTLEILEPSESLEYIDNNNNNQSNQANYNNYNQYINVISEILKIPKDVTEFESFYDNCEYLAKGVTSSVSKCIRKSDNKIVVVKKMKYKTFRTLSEKKIYAETPDLFDIMRMENILKKITFGNDDSYKYVETFIESFIDTNNKEYWIITEYIDGIELHKIFTFLKDNRYYLNPLNILEIAKDISEALYYLHINDISHGDLHLKNLIYDKKLKRVRLVDFGFSCDCGDKMLTGVTPPETLFSYIMKPDKIDNPIYHHNIRKYKGDMWSLGMILYTLINVSHLNNNVGINKTLRTMLGIKLESADVKSDDVDQLV